MHHAGGPIPTGGGPIRPYRRRAYSTLTPPRIPGSAPRLSRPLLTMQGEREFFIGNLLVRIHVIIVMIRWTGLAPWEFEFPFPGSLISTFLRLSRPLLTMQGERALPARAGAECALRVWSSGRANPTPHPLNAKPSGREREQSPRVLALSCISGASGLEGALLRIGSVQVPSAAAAMGVTSGHEGCEAPHQPLLLLLDYSPA